MRKTIIVFLCMVALCVTLAFASSTVTNLRFAGIMYSPSSFSADNALWMNTNLDMLITHESLLPYVIGKIPTVKTLVYKTSGWNNNERKVSVCCYSTMNAAHEDWFVHNGASRIRDSNTPEESYWMNYKSQGWITFSISDMQSSLNLYPAINGVFYDAVQVEKGETGNPIEYSNNADERNALFAMLTSMNSGLNKEFWVNGAPYTTGYSDYPGGSLALGKKLFDLSDGFFDESLGIDWGGNWYSSTILETQLSMMDYAQQINKEIVMSAILKKTTDYESVLSFYLLASNSKSYFGFNYQGYNFGSFYNWITANNALITKARNLGQPTATRLKSGDNYLRQFQGGYVMFNMVSHKGTITITGTVPPITPPPTTPPPTLPPTTPPTTVPTTTTTLCTDTDGNSVLSKGTVCVGTMCKIDSCETPTQVYEWTCVNNIRRQTLQTCPSNYRCDDGACKISSCSIVGDTNCDGKISRSELIKIMTNWINNRASLESLEAAIIIYKKSL